MAITVFTNAFLIDCTGADPVEGAAVVVEDDRIKDVAAKAKVSLKTVSLWQDGAPGALGDDHLDVPTLTIVAPDGATSFGTAVIVAPGRAALVPSTTFPIKVASWAKVGEAKRNREAFNERTRTTQQQAHGHDMEKEAGNFQPSPITHHSSLITPSSLR